MAVRSDTLANIKARIAIEEVIGDFVPLKKRGGGSTYWGCCPFHNERTPSFAVNAEKGFYKCFGCGKGGDAITFLEQKEGMNYLEGMRYLADKYGIRWEEEKGNPDRAAQKEEKERLHILLDFAADYYQQTLEKNSQAKAYLTERQITPSLAKAFRIGYSTTGWQDFYDYATSKGYGEEALEEVGLLVRREGKTYDRLRGRITFLLTDLHGQAVGIAGRIIAGQGNEPKYVNPPETKVYQKSHFLYGLYQAKKAMRQEGNVYLVEGYTDVLALHRASMPNVVSSSGTSLTEGQVGLLKRFTGKVTLLFDGDEAGLSAALRGIDLLLGMGLEVKIVVLPIGEDPDTYINTHGAEALRSYLTKQAQDFVTFQIYHLLDKVQEDPEKKSKAFQQMVTSLAQIPDAIKRGVYMELASQRTGLSLPTVEEAVRQRSTSASHQEKRLEKKVPLHSKRTRDQKSEEVFIHLLLHYAHATMPDGRKLATYLIEELEDVAFRTPVAQAIFEPFVQAWQADEALNVEQFITTLPEELKAKVADILAVRVELSQGWYERHHILIPKVEEVLAQLVETALLHRKKDFVQELLKEQRLLMAQAQDEAEVDLYLERHGHIKAMDLSIRQQLGVPILAAQD